MNAKELIKILQTYPPNTVIGAYSPMSGQVDDVTGVRFDAGESAVDHYIGPSLVLETDA